MFDFLKTHYSEDALDNMLHKTYKELIELIDKPELKNAGIIGCPIVSFGNINQAKIATVGINPSNREFVDRKGIELRRFPTLMSVGLHKWSDITNEGIDLIESSCKNYFMNEPYEWFNKLEFILPDSKYSFYSPEANACHLDLLPFATSIKWSKLKSKQRESLLQISKKSIINVIKESSIHTLILNGASVVKYFEKLANVKFNCEVRIDWTLPRKSGSGVQGLAYSAHVDALDGIPLNRRIQILGYNHNLQSSFGVNREINTLIKDWIAKSINSETI